LEGIIRPDEMAVFCRYRYFDIANAPGTKPAFDGILPQVYRAGGDAVTLGSHQQTIGKSQVHLTPRWILDALGPFDLDPCAATVRPWDCAARNLTEADDGLSAEWAGLVWLNPPFDQRQVGLWIRKLARHDNGIALLHARTETDWFEPIWQDATLILFLGKRVTFCKPDGSPCTVTNARTGKVSVANSGAPVVLAAFGEAAADRLRKSNLPGAYVPGNAVRLAA